MPTTTIRRLEGDELLEVLSSLNSYAFIASPLLDTKSIAAHYGNLQGNERDWRFETVDGRLAVAPAERADCDLTVQGLTALVYGPPDVQDLALRGWGDPAPALQDVMRTMFPPLTPYLHEFF